MSDVPLDWDEVRVFLVLYRSRTMGDAATALGVDASTVSRRLSKLEESLDATLFTRGRHGLAATAAADRLVPGAELMEQGIAQVAHAADSLERAVSGVVRVACPPDVAEVLLLPVLDTLQTVHPNLRLAIEPAVSTVDLTRREADIALRTVRPMRGDLVVTRLREIDWILAGAPELVADLGEVDDLEVVPWIGWGERMNELPMCQWLSDAVSAPPRVSTDDLSTQIAAARRGLGIAMVPDVSAAHHGLEPLRLAAGLREGLAPLPRDALYLVTHTSLRRVPRIAAVWEALLDAQ